MLREHGFNETKPSMYGKFSMLIVRDIVHGELKSIFSDAIDGVGLPSRLQFVERLRRYVSHKDTKEAKALMKAHLESVIQAVLDSLDKHSGGESNRRYLNNLYQSAIRASGPCICICRRPEQWFTMLSSQHDYNLDIIAPRVARSYAQMFNSFANMLAEQDVNINLAREIREELKATLMEFGFSEEDEKKVYRACGNLLDQVDHRELRAEAFEGCCYDVAYNAAVQLANRGVKDSVAHLVILDQEIGDFVSHLFSIPVSKFDEKRIVFAEHVAIHFTRDLIPNLPG
jgi:hypothetical protein